jgi:hypothetical protein
VIDLNESLCQWVKKEEKGRFRAFFAQFLACSGWKRIKLDIGISRAKTPLSW